MCFKGCKRKKKKKKKDMQQRAICGLQRLNIYHAFLYRKRSPTAGVNSKLKAGRLSASGGVDEGCSEDRPGPPQGWSGLTRTSRRATLAGRTAGGQMRAEVSKKEVSGQREVGFN